MRHSGYDLNRVALEADVIWIVSPHSGFESYNSLSLGDYRDPRALKHHDATGDSRRMTPAAHSLFFFSGIAALILQISWSRQIGMLLGQTIHAATTVLAAYFVGMAIGYLVGTRKRHSRRPLSAYGWCEVIVGTWAMLVPTLLQLGETPIVISWMSSTSATGQTAMRSLFCFVILLPATVSLGATLPFMAGALSFNSPISVGRISVAYGLNTLGAMVGVLATSFVLFAHIGVGGSGFLAAGISVCCGAVALLMSYRMRQKTACEATGSVRSSAARDILVGDTWQWTGVAALCGFATLALEILYTRLFSLVFHNSTYTFGAVVAMFLGGLAIGSCIAAILLKRVAAPTVLAVAAWLASLAVITSLLVFTALTRFEYFQHGESFRGYLMGSFGIVCLVVVPVITVAGILLPTLWSAAASSNGQLVGSVGKLTFANTIAAATGAVTTSFLLLPSMGLWWSFALVSLLFLGCSVWLSLRRGKRLFAVVTAASTIAVLISIVPFVGRQGRSKSVMQGEVLRRWHSAYGWIDVIQSDSGTLEIRQNIHYRHGATGKNTLREYRQAHIPLLLHPRPRDVLFLGLGTGLTAGPAVSHPGVERIGIVELIPEVVEAARLFDRTNFGIVDHSKTTVHIDDARHHLLRTDQEYDVVVSDLFVPWESRTGYLYTVEHYRVARRRLKPGGIFCQWLPVYQLDEQSFELIADSFASVFPTTTIWWGRMNSGRPIVALIGSEKTFVLEANRLRRRFARIKPLADGVDSYLTNPRDLRSLFLGRWPSDHNRPLNTDEHPRVEFRSPLAHQDHLLLSSSVFREYFDRVWMHLPDDGIQWRDVGPPPPQSARPRREAQRFILFGSDQ